MGFKTSLGLEALLVLIDLTASTFYGYIILPFFFFGGGNPMITESLIIRVCSDQFIYLFFIENTINKN